jgi:hypothetical protein
MNRKSVYASWAASLLLLAGGVTACADEEGGGDERELGDRIDDPSGPGPRDENTGAAAAAESPNPAWLVGTYAYGGKIENNIAFTSEDRAIEFSATTYRHKMGKDWTSGSGTWKVEGGRIILTGGYLNGRTFDLATEMSPNCRVLTLDTLSLARADVVKGCPFANPPLSADERCLAGTYTKSASSGSSSVSSSDSATVVLDPDRFSSRTTTSSSSRCYGTTCKSLYNSSAPVVGTWSLVNGELTGAGVTLAALRAYKFAPSDPSCGGPTGPGTGPTGGTTGVDGGSGGGGTSDAGSSVTYDAGGARPDGAP